MDNFFKERYDYQRYIIDYLVKKNKFIERDSKKYYQVSVGFRVVLYIK